MGLILPMLIGGWLFDSFLGGLAVAGFFRVVAVHHGTFFINSWCHYWGRQTYTDTNTAKDSFIMAVATMGEGYHNFHHFFANDYRNGVRWYHWDPTKWMIRTFAACGLAYGLRRTPWSEIIKAQLQMDEKRLKTRFHTQWQSQFQVQLDNLKVRIESAQVRFEQLRDEYHRLRDEYRELAKNYADSSMARLEEIKFQLRMARIEFKSALRQWRAYNSFLLQTCPA
jgi:stearoyl-CoA desaturase (delta-9 desaturase)